MARKKRSQKQEEFIDDTDFSTDECEVYRPTAADGEELEVDEEAYTVLEYIDLEWPSMSLDTNGSVVVLGTYPAEQDNGSQLVEVRLGAIKRPDGMERPEFKKHPTKRIFTKIRIHNAIFALSNDFLTKLDYRYKVVAEVAGSYRFGLCVSPEHVIVGCSDGYVEIYSHSLELISRISAGEAPIECVGFDSTVKTSQGDGVVVAGSLDHTVRVFDLKGNLISTIGNNAEINSLDVRGGHLVFGDDNGCIHLVDLSTNAREMIQWHCTPISFVRWRDDDVFLTGSDEQVCVWDKSLEEAGDANIPKNLTFVHQGQKYYKDCAFYNDIVIVTSEGGLCLFEPISLLADE